MRLPPASPTTFSIARLRTGFRPEPTTISIPAQGRLSASPACFAASATASVLAPDCRTMPEADGGCPLRRKAV